MTKTIKERREVDPKDKWNVEALFSTLAEWEKEFNLVCRPEGKPHFPELIEYKGRLGEGPAIVKEFLEKSTALDRKLSTLYTYAHMRADENLADDEYKRANLKITAILYDHNEELAWAVPEFLTLPNEKLETYLSSKELEEYRVYLERIVRMKPHTLTPENEELLAMAGQALGTPARAFSSLNNVDLSFPSVADQEGKRHELTHGKYTGFLRSQDRTLRKNAFEGMQKTFEKKENTICELMSGNVKTHLFHSRARKYKGPLEAALFPNEIDASVYTNLIDTVRSNISILHEYMEVRKKALGLDELHMYDLYVPLVQDINLQYDFDAATELVIESVAPLGADYQNTLKKGLLEDRWVDRFENKNKRSGAYSCGSYDSMPYILMNFQGHFHDLMTLAHEAGHSMHSYLTHKHQPYQYGHYPIFLAEIASTFNEELLFHLLMERDLSHAEKAYLLNQKIEDIRATFFRQTMFAEFELMMHQLAEESVPFTPALLKDRYRQLNIDYFGSAVAIDPEISIEWARIPHFYNNFYVYQYATGISAAHAFFEKVMKEGKQAKDAYLNFLSSGNSKYPLDLLEHAGVNMRHREPIEATVSYFGSLVKEFTRLMQI